VTTFLEPITGGGAHIYLSVLPFSPRGSSMYQHFQPKYQNSMSVQNGEMIWWPRRLLQLQGHQDWVDCVAFSPNGKHIVSGSHDKTIHIWDAETGQSLIGPLEGHQHSVNSVAFSPDGKHIVSGSSDYTLCAWDAETGQRLIGPLKAHQEWARSAGFSSDGKHIVSGSDDKTICIWDAQTGQCLI
jgi:WD40 repeat protein